MFKNKKTVGFTVLEVMIVLGIIAVLLLMAIPNLHFLSVNSRTIAVTNNIVGSLNLARNEAIHLNETVIFCASADHNSCSGQWTEGQIIVTRAGKIIHTFDPLPKDDILVWNSSLNKDNAIEFNNLGLTNGQTGTFIYCSQGKSEYGRAITLNQRGRIKVTKDLTDAQKKFCGTSSEIKR